MVYDPASDPPGVPALSDPALTDPALSDRERPVTGRSPAQVAFGSLVSLVTRLLAMPLAALATALMARAIGVESFGHLALGLGLVAVLNNVGDFGVGQVIVRDLSARPDEQRSLTAGFFLVRTASSVVLMLGGLAFVWWSVPMSARGTVVIVVLSLPFLAIGGLTAVAQARLRPQWLGLLACLQSATWLGLVVLCRAAGASPAWFAFAYAVGVGVQAVGAVLVARGLVSLDLRAAGAHARRLLAESWPLGLTGLFITAYYRLDQILLYNIAGAVPSGLYAAAYRYLDVVQVLPAALFATMLPVLSRLRDRNETGFQRAAELALVLAVASGAALGLLGIVLRHEIVDILYGPDFAGAADLVAILASAAPWISITYVVSGMLIVAHRPGLIGWVAAPAAVLNIALNTVLIPEFGSKAAAWLTVGTELAVAVATLVLLLRVTTFALPAARLLGCVVATAAMAASAVAVTAIGGNAIIAAAVSGAAFAGAVVATGALRKADLGTLLSRRVAFDA